MSMCHPYVNVFRRFESFILPGTLICPQSEETEEMMLTQCKMAPGKQTLKFLPGEMQLHQYSLELFSYESIVAYY